MKSRQRTSPGRWVMRIVAGLAMLCGAVAGLIYAASVVQLRRTYPRRDVALPVPSDPVSLARGEHIARLSCYGCHRERLQGRVMFDEPGVARIVTPNVLERMREYTDAELAGYMRFGVKKDGTSGVVMPPPGFYHMSDSDLASVIAYLRTQEPAATPVMAGTSIGPIGRMGVVLGKFRTAIHDIDTTETRIGADPAHRTTRSGEYLARMICASCHGSRLAGDPATKAPGLSGAVGYSSAQFTTLLREGTPNSPKALTLMAEVARSELKNLTDEEIASVFAYLRTLPANGASLARHEP